MEISIITVAINNLLVAMNLVSYNKLVEIYRGYRRSLKLNNIENETNLCVDSA